MASDRDVLVALFSRAKIPWEWGEVIKGPPDIGTHLMFGLSDVDCDDPSYVSFSIYFDEEGSMVEFCGLGGGEEEIVEFPRDDEPQLPLH